ncbi:WD40 repeat-like protein [Pluteus cervinus]|uniref:WD40 repeat-like protein n=1 Tax=Pluteus cervinus TaxID=181527 RepID=A0ACD3BET2_9AGAR|nr:WD40 repeat-like protein [Pluteus cervinus]
MLPSPTSSPASREMLRNRTNTPKRTRKPSLLDFPTPPPDSEKKAKKRVAAEVKGNPSKKAKVVVDDPFIDEESEESDVDEEEEGSDDDVVEAIRAKRNTVGRVTNSRVYRHASVYNTMNVVTRPILQTFVSSSKSDVYKSTSNATANDLTPPYACAFSNGSKAGKSTLLAVATEEGSIHVLDTKPRSDWDCEPQRVTIQPHDNGIFAVQWNKSDTLLASCSGDHSARISCLEKEETIHVLRGHTATVKCVTWDPTHQDLLTTGGRDGTICLWDLRAGEQRRQEGDSSFIEPVITILGAHDEGGSVGKPRPRRKKNVPIPRSITNVLYPERQPYGLVSSGSSDGVLRCWDLRLPTPGKKGKTTKPKITSPVHASPIDPTTLHGSRRPRGIISLTAGFGPSEGLLFGLGADFKVHTYALPTLANIPVDYKHQNLQATSFSIGLSTSPCGQWLACGSSGQNGSCFLFDIKNAARPFYNSHSLGTGVELRGQRGDICAVDWSSESLATCADDGTIRLWRPDLVTYRECQEQPEEKQWEWAWSHHY